MKLLFTTMAFVGMLSVSGNAAIIDVRATGYGDSYYIATMDAIDNAIRQSNPVVMSSEQPIDLSEKKISVIDTRDINIRSSDETESQLSSEEIEKPSWFSRVKFWGKQKSESEFYYRNKGGKFEVSDKSIARKIAARYEGQVESYEVVSAKHDKDGQHSVEINAKVKKLDKYESPYILQKAKYTVVMLTNGDNKTYSCMKQQKKTTNLENVIIDKMRDSLVASKKLSVVDRENFAKQLKELGLTEKDVANETDINKLKQVKVADYLLIIKVDNFNASTTTKTIQLTGEKQTEGKALLAASYKLIETATMEIVRSGSSDYSINLNSDTDCSNVTNRLVTHVGSELSKNLLDNLN